MIQLYNAYLYDIKCTTNDYSKTANDLRTFYVQQETAGKDKPMVVFTFSYSTQHYGHLEVSGLFLS